MEFKRIDINCKHCIEIINKYISQQPYRSCDYTLGGIYMWEGLFEYEYAEYEGFLIIRSKLLNRDYLSYSFPIGDGDIDKVLAEIASENEKITFSGVPESALPILIRCFKDRMTCKETPEWNDYIYDYNDLVNLTGKHNSKHRNHINKFLRTYPNYSFEWLDINDIKKIEDFMIEFNKESDLSDIAKYEIDSVVKTIKQKDLLNQQVGCIKVNDKIIAISMGEIVQDTLYIHIEKALREYDGVYAVINKEFAAHMNNGKLKYINREDDSNDEGLRKAKMSYHPIEFIKKHLVKVTNVI